MKASDYEKAALSTLSNKYHTDKVDPNLVHAAIGISTEAGELLDAIKKGLFYGKTVDMVNIREELGDLLWYVAVACFASGASFEALFEQNIAKLRARYPEKFTEYDALNRDLVNERKVLEAS